MVLSYLKCIVAIQSMLNSMKRRDAICFSLSWWCADRKYEKYLHGPNNIHSGNQYHALMDFVMLQIMFACTVKTNILTTVARKSLCCIVNTGLVCLYLTST